MRPAMMAWLMGAAGAGVVFALWPRGAAERAARDTRTLAALVGVMAALLAVGVVSGTLQRHVVQIAPLALAVVVVASGSSYGAAAAAPLLTFWLGLMVNIWLFLFGVLRIISGRFTPFEIALTLAIAACSVAGLSALARRPTSLSRGARLATSATFAVLQVAALIVSMMAGRA